MEKLKVRQLINGCGNLWKGLISHNDDFKVCLYCYDKKLQRYGYIEKSAWEWLDNLDYLCHYRDFDVDDWHFAHNRLFIKVYYLFSIHDFVRKEEMLISCCY